MHERTLRRFLTAAKRPSFVALKRKVGTGWKSTISEATLATMRRKLARNLALTAKELKASIPDLHHLSIRSIQRLCQKDLALPCRMMAKKPILTDKMKEKRLAFCRQYGHWTPDQWKKVMFSDESHFEINCFRGNLCRRPVRSDRFDPLFTRKTAKHPAKVIV
jgi:hypothetical protein